MKVELIKGSKTWGLIPHRSEEGHYHTGYEHERVGTWADGYRLSEKMEVGRNAILTGDFRVDRFTRGRSATGVAGHFRDNPSVSYLMSLDGIAKVFDALQSGAFIVHDGYFSSQWTFVKQGQNVYIVPYEAKS